MPVVVNRAPRPDPVGYRGRRAVGPSRRYRVDPRPGRCRVRRTREGEEGVVATTPYPLPGPDFHRLDQISLSWRTPGFDGLLSVRPYQRRPTRKPSRKMTAPAIARAASGCASTFRLT